jgi:predicted DNA-binding transcriptional regulator YafY
VDPYRLDRRDGRYLEMQAWCHENRMVRTFALNRVLEARVTEETFAVREWNASDEGVVGGLRGGPLVGLEVCFDAVVAPFARERQWPFKATFEEGAGGSLILRGQVHGMDGIVRELLSWRHHVRVLGGPELRARMVEEVRALAALYPDG